MSYQYVIYSLYNLDCIRVRYLCFMLGKLRVSAFTEIDSALINWCRGARLPLGI